MLTMIPSKKLTFLPALVCAAAVAVLPAGAQDAGTPPQSPLEALRKADLAARDALVAFVEDQVSSNAIFAGQYAALTELEWDAVPLLVRWSVAPPEGLATRRDGFRTACIHALRDCVETPSAELKATLAQIADDVIETPALRNTAQFALAQFGDRTRVDRMIEDARRRAAMEDPVNRARGWMALADVYYNLREFGEAAAAHQKVLAMIEEGELDLRAGLPTRYYNCACSMALAGRTEEALAHLEKALAKGKESGQQLPLRLFQTDMDIASLRDTPRFEELLESYFGPAAVDREK